MPATTGTWGKDVRQDLLHARHRLHGDQSGARRSQQPGQLGGAGGEVDDRRTRPDPEGATDETKARYAFGYGDFRRLHRTGLIACVYRASEWGHKQIELAAHELLQHLDGGRS